jgi:hypothetical protein
VYSRNDQVSQSASLEMSVAAVASRAIAPEPTTATGRANAREIAPLEGTVRELLETFFDTQRERCAAYERWNAASAAALAGTLSDEAFVSATTAATASMGALSEKVRRTRERNTRDRLNAILTTTTTMNVQIIACERGLRKLECDEMATMVRIVQMGERTRLEMTCALHALRRARNRGEWSWQRSDAKVRMDNVVRASEVNVDEVSGELRPSWAHVSGDNASACTLGCACVQEAPEPTREEFDNAVAEATQELERSAQEINDAVEELRYALEDEL